VNESRKGLNVLRLSPEVLGVFAVLQPLLGLNEPNYEKRLLGRVDALVTKHSSAFALHDTDRGVVSKVVHKIRLKDQDLAVRQVPRREPFAIRPFLQAEVQRLLAQGIIRVSFSPFSSGVVCVPKPDSPNSIRLCVDFRELNENTVHDGYPLPRIGDLLDRLQGAKFFSALDMQWGYLQIPVEEADKFKTAFVVQSGHYEYNYMPFGLKTAPATYQRLMERILSRLSKPCAFAYLDDVVVFSKTEEEHFQILEELFAIFEEYGLKLKPSKCQILRESVAILGVVVTRDGVSTNPKKIASVTNWSEPKNATELLPFLGFCNFYRWFVSDYAKLAASLYKCASSVPFEWNEELSVAFQTLKKALCDSPILALPDPDKPFILTTDASQTGAGACLMQKDDDGNFRAVSFFSKAFTATERKYNTYERELYAVVIACEHFRVYLLAKAFELYTDNSALLHLFGTELVSMRRVSGWILRLQGYPMRVLKVKGTDNVVADALSRIPVKDFGVDLEVVESEDREFCTDTHAKRALESKNIFVVEVPAAIEAMARTGIE
jgi:hypothetical protein